MDRELTQVGFEERVEQMLTGLDLAGELSREGVQALRLEWVEAALSSVVGSFPLR